MSVGAERRLGPVWRVARPQRAVIGEIDARGLPSRRFLSRDGVPIPPPLKRHRGRRWRFSAVRSTNVGSRPALCTAAPPLLPALADHLPVCGSPALATIRSDGELRNGSHRLQRALSRRRHRLSPDRSADAVAKDDQLSARRAGVPRAPGAHRPQKRRQERHVRLRHHLGVSTEASPEQLLAWNRGHWAVESKNHQRRVELTRFGGRVTSAVRDSVAERTVLPTEPVRQANGTRCRPSPGRGDGVEDGTLQPSGR